MKDVTFGQYYPTNSPIHRLDARFKIIATLLYIIFVFFIPSYIGYAVTLIFLLTTICIAKLPLGAMLKSLKAIWFLVVFMAILNLFTYKQGKVLCSWWIFTITDMGIDVAIKMSLRLIFIVMGASLLTLVTTPMEITDGIESLLKPLKYIKVPVHDLALVMSITLRFIPTLMEEADKIMMAQKARGSAIDTGGIVSKVKALVPVLIPLFTSAWRKSYELADALDARCYNATPHRTKMKELKFSYRDAIALIVMILFIVFICLDQWYFHNLDIMLINFIRGLM